MGLFGLFSKEKKESLDTGLAKTKESVFKKIQRAIVGKSKVDDEVLDNLEDALITSDVGVDTTLKIIKRLEERVAKDKYVGTSELNKILKEVIISLLNENTANNFSDSIATPRRWISTSAMDPSENSTGTSMMIPLLSSDNIIPSLSRTRFTVNSRPSTELMSFDSRSGLTSGSNTFLKI